MNLIIARIGLLACFSCLNFAMAAPVAPKLPDVLQPLPPSAVKLGGFLGERAANNVKNRLLVVDENDLLDGFRHRPGRQAWIGEHVGKFLHAATLAWANTGEPKLREKLDRVANALIKTQEPDGYLGTYTKDKRFGLYPGADWDVWVHKYNLIGLLTYHEHTGNAAALESCRKIGDLLLATFGPGKKSIIVAGTHVGMAATSVLEPMVLLYRATGDQRYLDFAQYLVSAWDEPNGPKIIKTLTETGKVNRTANGKAYEMLSNLVGLCELARATGEVKYLEAPKKAWADIVANQLYITGTASHHEHFHADHELPHGNSANMGETCVTTTWIQLNWQLLRLTGEAQYGDEIERSYYNHLAGAQLPDGSKWCYYTPLEGTKPYGNSTNCCLSSGPRALALLPHMIVFKQALKGGGEVLCVNLWETVEGEATLNGNRVRFTVLGPDFSKSDEVHEINFTFGGNSHFQLLRRVPSWSWDIAGNGHPMRTVFAWAGSPLPQNQRSYWRNVPAYPWKWKVGQSKLAGTLSNANRTCLTYGPLVLAYDEKLNPGLPPARLVTLAENATAKPKGEGTFEATLAFKDGTTKNAVFVPFAQAGATGGRFAVWLRAPGNFPEGDTVGREARSREGNVNGSINDGDNATYVVTFDGTKANEDWYEVRFDAPRDVTRVVFAHGHVFHDGGWFDASGGKPQVQIQREKNGAWETIGTLDDYPATTASDPRGLKDGQTFTLKLNAPVKLIALRVVGKPACGDNPQQAFSSCGELSALPN